MSANDSLKAKSRAIILWLGIAIFCVSLGAGVFRSLARDQWIPGVGVEYISELRKEFHTKGYQQTLPWMISAVEIDMDNDTTARELLAAARQAGDVETAVSTLEKLVRLQPQDAELRTELVTLLLEQGRVVEALTHADFAVRLDPNSPSAYGNLGTALLALDLKDQAAAAFRRTLQLDPNNQNAQRALEFPLRGH